MKQTVLIGLGGTGSRTVNNVAHMLREKNIEINDGIVTCAVLDTNQADNELVKATGTNIPVIPTCDEKTIDEYLAQYAGQDPRSWCPYSRAFGQESMIDGASEMRAKSRIAFMDTMATSTIFELQNAIEKVFHNRPGTPEKIRVMIVSSLAGGTGSGMFIQVALWMRQFFQSRNCQATIRGILLLPDIFVRTIANIRESPRKMLYHYANAYAAVREMNAINKVIKDKWQPERPIVITDLFDSRNPPAKPIFDNAFFIDDVDAKGAAFDSMDAYEKMAAQIVYMQLYAPMHNELVSVEDNLFRAFERSSEPIFGSCGTAKAVYPGKDVAEYCALRAAEESIAQGWSKLDVEIAALQQEEKNAERDGVVLKKRISVRDTYVKLFEEKTNQTESEIGRGDRLFVAIRKDVFDETREPAGKGDETVEVLTCKVEKFMNLIDEEIQRSITENGGCKKISRIGNNLPDPENPDNFPSSLENDLKGIREEEKSAVQKVLKDFDENCGEYAAAIIRAIVPLDMGAINQNNEKTFFGLFQKKDADGKTYFVHPIAARYLLYRLSQKIEEEQKKLVVDKRRRDAEAGDTKKVSFDNPNTRKRETMDEYWEQVGWHVSKKELQHFVRKYKEFNLENKNLCMQYETEYLKQMVLNDLTKKLNDLIQAMESLFKDFHHLSSRLAKDIAANVERNSRNLEKTLYIYAKGEHKNAAYEALGMDIVDDNKELYKEVLESIYGKFCAEHRPSAEENKQYANKSVISAFYQSIVNSFMEIVEKKHSEEIYMDVISAISAESDYVEKENQGKKTTKKTDEEEEALFSNETEASRAQIRHHNAVISYRNRLEQMAAPFLQAKPDASLAVISDIDGLTINEDNEIWMVTGSGRRLQIPLQTTLTFWGYHPDVAKIFPEIDATLGTNKATAASEGYGIDELYCYSSIYGVKAEAITKFNEKNGGAYYENYSAVINTMLKENTEIDTPHIDKTWHEFLPYVSSSMQSDYMQRFYKTLWRAVAYDRISLDADGIFRMSEKKVDVYGEVVYEFKPLMEKGKVIMSTDVLRLIKALRVNPQFETMMRELDERFEADVDGMSTYIGTDIIKGLMVKGDLNPVTMIVRYALAKDSNTTVRENMIGGLRVVLKEVASNYNMNRSDELVNEARIRLCHRIYKESDMKKKSSVMESWVKEFKSLKLDVEKEATEATGTAIEEDII